MTPFDSIHRAVKQGEREKVVLDLEASARELFKIHRPLSRRMHEFARAVAEGNPETIEKAKFYLIRRVKRDFGVDIKTREGHYSPEFAVRKVKTALYTASRLPQRQPSQGDEVQTNSPVLRAQSQAENINQPVPARAGHSFFGPMLRLLEAVFN